MIIIITDLINHLKFFSNENRIIGTIFTLTYVYFSFALPDINNTPPPTKKTPIFNQSKVAVDCESVEDGSFR